MYKPGQIVTINGRKYRISKKLFAPCIACGTYYRVQFRILPPCWRGEMNKIPCTHYCGAMSYPKLIEKCGKKDKK